MVVTMLEAELEVGRTDDFVRRFQVASDSLPPAIVESFLLQDAASGMWRIVTVWESQEALDGYRAAVDTPEGVLMFRSAGAEPALTVFSVRMFADHT